MEKGLARVAHGGKSDSLGRLLILSTRKIIERPAANYWFPPVAPVEPAKRGIRGTMLADRQSAARCKLPLTFCTSHLCFLESFST